MARKNGARKRDSESVGTTRILKNRRMLYRRYALHHKPHAIRILTFTIKKKKGTGVKKYMIWSVTHKPLYFPK